MSLEEALFERAEELRRRGHSREADAIVGGIVRANAWRARQAQPWPTYEEVLAGLREERSE